MKKPIDLNSLISSYNNLSPEIFNKIKVLLGFSIKDTEIEQISSLINKLDVNDSFLNYFYVGYSIPQINKEFDLLKFGEKFILNIEIKSKLKDNDAHEQLIKNKYYLSSLNKEIKAFSYIEEDDSIYYLEDDNSFSQVEFSYVSELIATQEVKHIDNIDDLFDPEEYLVSPFNQTDKFINDTYFLTQQQQEFKKNILKKHSQFTVLGGQPGTGKTLLLYDLAKELMKNNSIVIIHTGNLNDGHLKLNSYYGWNILPAKEYLEINDLDPQYVFVDETQRMYPNQLETIINYIKEKGKHGIFSIDPNQILSLQERKYKNLERLMALDSYNGYKLSKKIRTNKELGAFIKGLFNLNKMKHCNNTDNISIHYFDNIEQARSFSYSMQTEGWQILDYTSQRINGSAISNMKLNRGLNAHHVLGQEFDKVLVVMGEAFYYNDKNGLHATHINYYDTERMLYQSITRARKQLMILIVNNPELIAKIMDELVR